VKLVIIDDGQGFDLAALKNKDESYGIRGMLKCAAKLGDTLDVVSRPGKGTRLCAAISVLNI
jgi:signal transduction histidine kinase